MEEIKNEIIPFVAKETTISIPTINKVKEFVSVSMCYKYNASIESGRYCIDAKSIMGLFSLDVSKPLKLIIEYPAGKEDIANDFLESIKDFIINK